MTKVRCLNNRHYYDSSEHDNCPYCEDANNSSNFQIPDYIAKGENLRKSPNIMSETKVEIKIGNAFDIKSDLIILPCNTIGNVTEFVYSYIDKHNIPAPPPDMSLGYVHFQSLNKITEAAKFVGYAVSVDRMTSSLEAINYIGQKIGQFTTQNPSIRTISSPLIGTGAGGLSSEDVAFQLKKGFLTRAHPESKLIISVLHADIYKNVIKKLNNKIENIKVFLCHSSSDKPIVRKLYRALKAEGVSTWFDEESLLPGQNWESEIIKAVKTSHIVIVCISESSVNKRGFLQKEIKFALSVAEELPEDSLFIIPLRLEECEIPFSLKQWQWVNYYEESGYAKLLRSLELVSSNLENSA